MTVTSLLGLFSLTTALWGYSLLLKDKAIIAQPDRVTIANGHAFGCILMKDLLRALVQRLKRNSNAYEKYHRIFVPERQPSKCQLKEPLKVNVLFQHIQKMISSVTAVIAETRNLWFKCQKLKLPRGCGYEFQMQYGLIGCSVEATFGYPQAVPQKLVIPCVGDGSFRVTTRDISIVVQCGQKTIIFLINNGGHPIEVEIHDGPYSVIKNWNYIALVNAINNGDGKCWTVKVFCEEN